MPILRIWRKTRNSSCLACNRQGDIMGNVVPLSPHFLSFQPKDKPLPTILLFQISRKPTPYHPIPLLLVLLFSFSIVCFSATRSSLQAIVKNSSDEWLEAEAQPFVHSSTSIGGDRPCIHGNRFTAASFRRRRDTVQTAHTLLRFITDYSKWCCLSATSGRGKGGKEGRERESADAIMNVRLM